MHRDAAQTTLSMCLHAGCSYDISADCGSGCPRERLPERAGMQTLGAAHSAAARGTRALQASGADRMPPPARQMCGTTETEVPAKLLPWHAWNDHTDGCARRQLEAMAATGTQLCSRCRRTRISSGRISSSSSSTSSSSKRARLRRGGEGGPVLSSRRCSNTSRCGTNTLAAYQHPGSPKRRASHAEGAAWPAGTGAIAPVIVRVRAEPQASLAVVAPQFA